MSKRVCPVTRSEFRANAKPIVVTVDGQRLSASVKEFQTSSLGWYLSGKVTLEVGGVPVDVQIGTTVTIIGSKELPKDSEAA